MRTIIRALWTGSLAGRGVAMLALAIGGTLLVAAGIPILSALLSSALPLLLVLAMFVVIYRLLLGGR